MIERVSTPTTVNASLTSTVRVDRTANRTVVSRSGTAERVRTSQTTVRQIAQGPQGLPGPAGLPGGAVQPITFSYGDASGAIYTPSAAGTITVARVVIETPFNGAAPTLQIGTLAEPGAAMAATDNDPTSAGEYEVTADLHMAAGEPLRITVAPDGSTAGSGRIYLTFIPD